MADISKFSNAKGNKIIAVPQRHKPQSFIKKGCPQGNCLFIAPSNTGKTTTIVNMLLKKHFGYQKQYETIHIMSPTAYLDDTWEIIHEWLKNERERKLIMKTKLLKQGYKSYQIPKKYDPDDEKIQFHEEYDEEFLNELMENNTK